MLKGGYLQVAFQLYNLAAGWKKQTELNEFSIIMALSCIPSSKLSPPLQEVWLMKAYVLTSILCLQ